MRAAMVAAIVLSVPAMSARAQEVAYAATLTELDSTTQAAVGREIARARERGLPVDPLVAKVREGRLKRASAARIRAAVERLSERLAAARDALGPASTAEEVTAGADAIAAGAQSSSLRAVRAATTQSVTAGVGALAQLLASGVAEAKAVDMVIGLLRRNASPTVLVALGNQVEADVATGLSPTASAAFRLRAIEDGLRGGVATDAVTAPLSSGNLSHGTAGPPQRKP